MRSLKKIAYQNFIPVLYNVLKMPSFSNILTFSKAFDSIQDFENLGYQAEVANLFQKFQRLHKPTTIKSIPI